MKGAHAACAMLALAGCATPQQLPVAISGCAGVANGRGYALQALVQNRAFKPISAVRVNAEFYRDFRHSTVVGVARFPAELDPGKSRETAFEVAAGGIPGQAMRCFATRIEYLDGTAQNAQAPAG